MSLTRITPAQQTPPAPARYALLIGIDHYNHPPSAARLPGMDLLSTGRYEPKIVFPDLEGPSNDVDAMRTVLTRKFHFSPDPQHMTVLLDGQATHAAILKALQSTLVDTPKKGDEVVLYVSAHGSLRIYARGEGDGPTYNLLADPSDQRHAENTIVPYDWNDGVDDVFSRDLRHFYRLAADKGIHVTAIFDSCHSGDLGRAVLSGKIISRDFLFDPREMPANIYAKEERPTLPQDDPLTPVLILSAAQKDQLALEDGTAGPAHGVFTSALVEALNALPEDRPVTDVFSRLQVSMELAPHSIHQQPELDTSAERRRQPIFGGAADHGPTTAAVVVVRPEGALLDIGIVADIGPGSVFTTLPAPGRPTVRLRVTKDDGLGRSLAEISPAGAEVKPGEIVQLQAAVAAPRPDLLVYAGAATPPLAEVQAAVAVVAASGHPVAGDPSRESWVSHLQWDGSHWMLSTHSRPGVKVMAPVDFGPVLTAKSMSRVPAGVLWFDPPLAREIAQMLLTPATNDAPPIAAKLTPDRAKAVYLIASRLLGDKLSYAWFKRSDVDAEVQTPALMGAGCSPGSSYPLHTEWVDQTAPEATAAALNKYAVNLAKLNGWFHLESSALGEHSAFPYTLALRPTAGGSQVGANGTTHPGAYDLFLVGNPTEDAEPRWVYVLNIDCQGNGSVVWPYDAPAGKASQPPRKFPLDDTARLSTEIRLPGEPFPVQPPLGTDTYMLLVTATRLSDYHALAFDRLVSKGVTDNPLELLLYGTSGGSRDVGDPIPTNWGVSSIQVQSEPLPKP